MPPSQSAPSRSRTSHFRCSRPLTRRETPTSRAQKAPPCPRRDRRRRTSSAKIPSHSTPHPPHLSSRSRSSSRMPPSLSRASLRNPPFRAFHRRRPQPLNSSICPETTRRSARSTPSHTPRSRISPPLAATRVQFHPGFRVSSSHSGTALASSSFDRVPPRAARSTARTQPSGQTSPSRPRPAARARARRRRRRRAARVRARAIPRWDARAWARARASFPTS
mmetsp:Transcript_5266/g.20522  ORF Transcript_5266/g.20522 Transcript_5266/m.20522 type:complete len:222 (-) Transcript_5266:160-825(-)